MLKSLSRILGMTGSILALSAIIYDFMPSEDYYVRWAIDVIIVLMATASLAACFIIHKRTMLAGVLMIIPGVLLIPCFSGVSLPSFIPDWVLLIPTPPLIAGGVLALVSAARELQNVSPNLPGDGHKSMYSIMNKLSRIFGIIFAALNMLPWILSVAEYIDNVFLTRIPEPYDPPLLLFPIFLVTAAGFWGSLITRKKPTLGPILMLVSGGMTLGGWLIPSLLLIAAGVFTLVSSAKTSPAEGPGSNGPDNTAKD